MKIQKYSNQAIASIIRNQVLHHNLYLILTKDAITYTNNDLTYKEFTDANPELLLCQSLGVNSNIQMCYDTEDDTDYDISYIDTSGLPVTRYLKYIDINDSETLNNIKDSTLWLYISTTIDWSNIGDDIIGQFETSFKNIFLADLYDSMGDTLELLPQNGLLYSYEYDNNTNLSYNFSKNSSFKDIFEFYVKFNIGG